jgi:hypothetical protein
MARFKLTSELLSDIIAHIPEGFLHRSLIARRLRLNNRDIITDDDRVTRDGEYFYDPSILSLDNLRELRNWARPTLPDLRGDGTVVGPSIQEQREARSRLITSLDQNAAQIMNTLAATPGFYDLNENPELPGGEAALEPLLESGALQRLGSLLYDPLRLSPDSIREVTRRRTLLPIHQQIIEFLQSQPGQTAPQQAIVEKFGADEFREAVSLGGLSRFSVSLRVPPYSATWVRTKESSFQEAQRTATAAYEISSEQWQEALEQSGHVARPNTREANTLRAKVHAHTYTVNSAAKRLGLRSETIEAAARQKHLSAFTDPEGVLRFPAHEIDSVHANPERHEQVAGLETVKGREIALVGNLNYTTLRRRLRRAGINRSEPYWEQVRGKWRLPKTLIEFRQILKDKLAEIRAKRALELEEERRLLNAEQQRRAELRERLVAAFPTWQHEKRQEQRIYLHIGPPNSGKTHDALNALSTAGEGWYLAPLRLLAFEIFDRLNQRGVPCSLLTGEEYIPVEGARITSATVEMFNPNRSGECVIIDEAQMLADPDRGWAWTRALMEAQAPRIHVIGPLTARALIERMSAAAAIPLTLVKHERLAPVEVAARNWPLRDLKPRTILVAFSRQAVLELKTELEQAQRTVSVIYGSLPPEVRRKQADRFADGKTEICVATDAVGMGLNLPADYVCFYEVKKFDGKQTRLLTPGEIQQIGGRAGRYGLSTAGEVGATTMRDLRVVRNLFYAAPALLTHARVAPTVEDLEMIPGSLAERLAEWASLKSIPESLRGAIEIADMTERIELASMLSEREVEQLGLAAALQLVNAPTRQSSRAYWYSGARALLSGNPLPLPPVTRAEISDSVDLERLESYISYADIYLWLSHRKEFAGSGPDAEDVRQLRLDWSNAIDRALLMRLDTARRCARCKKPLPRGHRYAICDACFREQHNEAIE